MFTKATEPTSSSIIINFTITPQMVTSFVRLTGDRNSLHTNDEFARKTRFRRTIVHGMLPFSFVGLLQSSFPLAPLRFRGFKTRFHKPIQVGDEIRLELSCHSRADAMHEFRGRWYRFSNEELLISTSGTFCLIDDVHIVSSATSHETCFVTEGLKENTFSIHELEGKSEELPFRIIDELRKMYVQSIFLSEGKTWLPHFPVCPNLQSTLLLSTLVGMRLPGRFAVFTDFKIDFITDIEEEQPYRLCGVVTKSSILTEDMHGEVSIQKDHEKVAEGKVEVMLHPAPKVMVSCEHIRVNHLDFGLGGKVVVITGASQGIGEATAKLFGSLGSQVIVNYYRGKEDSERIVREIEASGGKAIAIRCDITREVEVKNCVEAVLSRFGRIDILVNNAVREFTSKGILELTWEEYLQEMEVTIKGLHACCQAVIPQLKKLGCGKIINMSTVAVDNPVIGQSRYITAKSAVVGYTKSLAKELAKFNIQVNLVVPNMTETDLISGISSLYQERIKRSNPYQRHVMPIEVAQSIAFLASNWSNAMTGQKLVLNLGEVPFA